MSARPLANNLGLTLVEILVATLILSILAIGIAQMTSSMVSINKEIDLQVAQNSLAAEMRRYILSRQVVVATIQARDAMGVRRNPGLHNCVCGVGTCRSMEQPFPALTLQQGVNSILAPRTYDQAGFNCDPTIQNCAFQVNSEFFAECAPDFAAGSQNPVAQCDGRRAEFVTIIYKVEPTNWLRDLHPGKFNTFSGATFVDVKRLNLSGAECL